SSLMKRTLLARRGLVYGFSLVMLACNGGVVHPDSGEPNTRKYCADRNDTENNCTACSSQPGCGWCDVPQSGQAHCQPGTSAESPGSCQEGWALSTEDCEAPPPPPPPPPTVESDADPTQAAVN